MDNREKLRCIMEDAQMNAKQFAEAVGISAGTISNIMSGRNNPSLEVMQAVLRRFRDVSIEWLILDTGSIHGGKHTAQPSANSTESETPKSIIHQPDLFSQFEAPVTCPQSTVPAQQTNIVSPADMVNTTNVTVVQQPKTKHIQRVLVLYDDGSFEER